MNTHQNTTSSNRHLLLILDLALIAISFNLSDFIVRDAPQVNEQYTLFFGTFALVWAVVSGFTHFFIRVDSLLSCGRKVANLLNAFLLHALVLLAGVVIFNLSYLPALPLLYTYGATAALIMFSRMLLIQIVAFMRSAIA